MSDCKGCKYFVGVCSAEKIKCQNDVDIAYQQGRADAIEECIKTVKSYFCELIDENPEWEMSSVDDFALIPNKEICKALEKLKEGV